MIHQFSFRLFIGLTCLILASCATLEEQAPADEIIPEPANWLAEQQKRQQIEIWEIRGRLGVQTEYTGGSMDIIWKQSGQEYSIRLIAPMGAGNYMIQGDAEFAEIKYPNGRKQIIKNMDEIFVSTLEVDLPATAIKDWVRGLPAKALTVERISWNEQGLLNTIQQSGWNVEMAKYNGSKILLPHAIYLSRDDNPELDIRLVLRQWLVDN